MIKEMVQNGVCAVFTTFHPEADVLENISAVRPQVQHLVVVDNGSPSEAIEALVDAAESMDFHLIKNPRNLGIASALNIGSQWSMEKGCSLLLYFDQDSTATPGMVAELLNTYRTGESPESIGLVATTNRERHTGFWVAPLHDKAGEAVLAMTSGSLVPAAVLEKCGPFEDDFFIEFVDHEFCLRLRSYGYRILLCSTAVMTHDVGFPRTHSFLGLFRCRCIHHRPARRYYFARNLLVLVFRYWRTEPLWARVELVSFFKSLLKVTIFEDHRTKKLWMVARGLFDGMRHALGYRVAL